MAAQMDQTVKNSPSAISSGFGTSDSLGKSHYRPVRPNSCNTILGNPDGKNGYGTAAWATDSGTRTVATDRSSVYDDSSAQAFL